MNHILKNLSGISATDEPCVLGTILRTTGSSPQVPGASALFTASGVIAGTLGGGVLEFESAGRSKKIAGTGEARLFTYELNADIYEDRGAICGGKVLVLLDGSCNSNSSLFSKIQASLTSSMPGILLTLIIPERGENVVVRRSWHTMDSLNDYGEKLPGGLTAVDLRKYSGESRPELIERGDILIFVEPIMPLPELVIVGAGHIGQALAHLGSLLDFNVTVIDNRPEYASRERLPDAGRIIADDIATGMRSLRITHDTYIVIMTTGHADDTRALRECISSEAAYIGMIGSRRKIAQVRQRFIDEKWSSAEQFDRVHAPIGLSGIPTKTIQEIAVSIAAELIVVRHESRVKRDRRQVWSLVLAAGESKRMQEQKLLMPVGQDTMIGKVVKENLRSKTGKVMVVLGSDHEKIREKIPAGDIKMVINHDYKKGMFSSVRKGIGSLPGDCTAAVIALGDQPMISFEVIDRMVDAFVSGTKGIIIPVSEGKRGHPLLIANRYFREITGMDDNESLRNILSAHESDILEMEVGTDDILRDIDTIEDYRKEIHK